MRTLYHTAKAQVRDAESALARSKMVGLSTATSDLEEIKKLELSAMVRAQQTTDAQAAHNRLVDDVADKMSTAAQASERERILRAQDKKRRDDAKWS